MKKLILLFMLATLVKESRSNRDETRLRRYIFDPGYQKINDLTTTPVDDVSDVMSVKISIFIVKLIAVEELAGVLKLQHMMRFEWEDRRLAWSKTAYGNISETFLHSSSIWTPNFMLINNAKIEDENEVTPLSSYVSVNANGWCVWEPRFELSVTHCDVDVTWFPFDDQTCDLVFESWTMKNDSIDVAFNNETFVLRYYHESDEWKLQLVEWTLDLSSEHPVVTFTLHLRRLPLYYITNIAVPCSILAVIAVASFLLHPGCSDRIGITLTMVLSLAVYQIIVSDKLPSSSTSVPIIVIYFLFLICLCVFAVVVTILVQRLHVRSETAPIVAMPIWMNNLFCKTLAACVCMAPASPSPEPHLTMYKIIGNVDSKSNKDQGLQSDSGENDEMKKMLTRLCQLMETRVQNEEEQRNEDDRENEIKNDWILAAAVLDRICAVAVTVFFVAGSVAFFVLFAKHK